MRHNGRIGGMPSPDSRRPAGEIGGTYHTLSLDFGTVGSLERLLRAIGTCVPAGPSLEFTAPFGRRTTAFLRKFGVPSGTGIARASVLPHDGRSLADLADAVSGSAEREGAVYLYMRAGDANLLEVEASYDWLWLADALPSEVHRCMITTIEGSHGRRRPVDPTT